jgi:aspartate kinase
MLFVQKFGGTSVADIDRIRNVARRAIKTKRAGNDVVVVVSAMAGETNRLLKLSKSVTPEPSERESDVLVATGEQVTSALTAMAIQHEGEAAESFLGHQVRIVTDSVFSKARIQSIDCTELVNALKEGKIAVVAGFQGVDPEGNITTLGRGGSDTTAVAIAAAMKADVCEIYTDVDGVYTTDPNICPSARKLSRISFEEMLELASLGAKVLQIRSVEFGMKYGVPIHVRTSFNESEGTWVVEEESEMEQVVVSGVAYNRDEAKITIVGVPDHPGIAASIFTPLSEASIVVDMIIQNASSEGRTDLTFTVPKGDFKRAMETCRKTMENVGGADIRGDENIAKISIVGVGMRSHAGVATKMFSILSKEGVNIQMISTSEIKISCVVDAKYTELAVRALHDGFGLGNDPTSAP